MNIDYEIIEQRVKRYVKEKSEVGVVGYKTWIEPLEICSIDESNDKIVFYFMSGLTEDGGNCELIVYYVMMKFGQYIVEGIEKELHKTFQIEIIVKNGKKIVNKDSHTKSGFYPNKTFENFIVDVGNLEAVKGVKRFITEKEGGILLLKGPKKRGKTHLLWAAANFLWYQGKVVKYRTIEDFVSSVIEAVRNCDMSQFIAEFYDEKIDMLLIDDIDWCVGKEMSESALKDLLQYVLDNHKKIIVAVRPERYQMVIDSSLKNLLMQAETLEIFDC